jgi:CBS domain-containing protein
MLIGWFLLTAAQASYQQAGLQQILSGVKVKDIMTKDIVALSPVMTIDEAVNNYFLRYGYGGFPVVDEGKLLGLLTLKEVRDIPREDWGKARVSAAMTPHDRRWRSP